MKYLVISTPSNVHIFDAEAFGRNLFWWGLYSVLGKDDCVKIVHDCRQLFDIKNKQFDLNMEHVFDTMAATKKQTFPNVCQN